jgi:DNA-binding NtrC family response regulator
MSGSQAQILILDDDADVAYAAQLLLRRRAGQVKTLADPKQLTRCLQEGVPEVVLLDFNFTPGRTDGAEGLKVLDQLQALARPPAVIAMTAYADVPLAVEAMKRGACDFITKPWDNARLVAAVDGALARHAAGQSPGAVSAADPLTGSSAAMRELRACIANVGPTEANVMVLGENGVGKELVARAIHQASRRAANQLLAVDMGSLPEAMLESELFGHRKGSFTDARSDRAGRFQAASGGTLFLDEIGNLPLAAQSKLLTALERREVTPLGADRPETIDVRIVSATNLDEAKLYDALVFRPDLLFRLNTIVIRVPPLRDRPEDIPALLAHYLAHYQRQYGRPARTIAPSALDTLYTHAWPGNVRALRHACERAVILAGSDLYGLADFGLHKGDALPASAPSPTAVTGDALKLDVLERDAISAALEQAHGNISRAAKLLGVSRAALYRKLEKHGL